MKSCGNMVVMDKFIEPTDIEYLSNFVKTKMPDDDWVVKVYVNGHKQHCGQKVTIYDNAKASNNHIDKLV